MIRPDEDMLRALAAGVYPPTDAEARAMAAEVLRLRAIVDGRTTPPTVAEDEAARSVGLYPVNQSGRWHLFDATGRIRAWPVVGATCYVTTSCPGAVIEVQEHRLSPEECKALDFGRKPFGGGR